jgi:hypothetical protein
MCMKPIHLKQRGATVPCSKCPQCIARKTSAWSFRLMQEEKQSSSSHFLTLTYDTTYLPFTHRCHPTLQKRDLQLFFKRLRKSQPRDVLPAIKYYAVGEYGGRTRRPHYHIILFNAQLELINSAWDQGHIYYGNVSGASVGYTLKYMMKHKKRFKLNPDDDRQIEFALMSKGLGIGYLSDTMANWHVADLINRNYCSLPGGVKISMPRYYKDKLYLANERSAIAEAFSQITHENQLKKLSKQTTKSVRNEQQAIDAAFDRMYKSSQKIKL